jgi:hypothetical protein
MSLDDFANRAGDRYVRDLQRQKLAREIEAYERLHGQLKESCLGQWVAIHQGELIDHDVERSELHRRVRRQFGRTSVLIRQVFEQPDKDIRWRGGSMRWLPA